MAASERYFPTGQIEQEVDLVVGVNEPTEQRAQEDSESCREASVAVSERYFPFEHEVQVDDPVLGA
jgi:hypothetical protein